MAKRPTDRRTVLVAAGTLAFAAATGTAAAQSVEIHGTVSYAGGAKIPEGRIKVYLEDLAVQDSTRRRLAETGVSSDGGPTMLNFSFTQATGATGSSTLRIVARLERKDGWLLARGSTAFGAGSPVHVVLNEAVY